MQLLSNTTLQELISSLKGTTVNAFTTAFPWASPGLSLLVTTNLLILHWPCHFAFFLLSLPPFPMTVFVKDCSHPHTPLGMLFPHVVFCCSLSSVIGFLV